MQQICLGKAYVLTMVEATNGWLETYPVPHVSPVATWHPRKN